MKEHLKRRALILLALAIIVGVTSLFLYNVSFNPSFSAMDLVTSASKKSRQKPKEDTTENVAGWEYTLDDLALSEPENYGESVLTANGKTYHILKNNAKDAADDDLIMLSDKEDNFYQAGQCLQCGCCLEVCPNFLADNAFSGAAAIVNAYRDIEQQTSDEHRKEMIQGYRQKFFAYCGQSFSCKRSARKNFLWMKYRQG